MFHLPKKERIKLYARDKAPNPSKPEFRRLQSDSGDNYWTEAREAFAKRAQ